MWSMQDVSGASGISRFILFREVLPSEKREASVKEETVGLSYRVHLSRYFLRI